MLARVETCVSELRNPSRPEIIERDLREQRFVEHTLQIAVQAALDAASHIVSDERLGEPRSDRELFDLLARAGFLGDDLAARLQDMAGFRNVLVTATTASTWRSSARSSRTASTISWRS